MTDMRAGYPSDDLQQSLAEARALLKTDPARALERARRLSAEQTNPPALRIAAAALRALDRNAEAESTELEAIRSGFPAQLREVLAALHSGDNAHAKALAGDFLRENPDDLLAMTIMAQCAIADQDARSAEAITREVLSRASAFPQAAILLANSLESQVRLSEAIDVLEKLRQRLPQDAIVLRYLADLHVQAGRPEHGAELYGEILATRRADPMDLFKYAQNLRAAGSTQESIAALRRATGVLPIAGNAWWALAHYFPEDLSEEDMLQIDAALGRPSGDSDQRALLRVAASFARDRRGEHEAAFDLISSLKAERRQRRSYDPDALTRHVDQLIGSFAASLSLDRRSEGSSSNAPIFIVGMPRSGSTLVERILGMHSQVEGLGEVPIMQRAIEFQTGRNLPSDRSLLPDELERGVLEEVADWYLRRSREFRHADTPRFIDKRNANWIHSGLIQLIFPNSRIIDVRRDAVDCCWSMFKMLHGDDYANDERHLARYYADYVRLMDALRAKSPNGILTVSYEELVADPEGQTRKMLEFLGLDYEPASLDFHLSSAAVSTPSSEQVRRPINSENIGSAKPYLKWLGPLTEELDSLGIKTTEPS